MAVTYSRYIFVLIKYSKRARILVLHRRGAVNSCCGSTELCRRLDAPVSVAQKTLTRYDDVTTANIDYRQ